EPSPGSAGGALHDQGYFLVQADLLDVANAWEMTRDPHVDPQVDWAVGELLDKGFTPLDHRYASGLWCKPEFLLRIEFIAKLEAELGLQREEWNRLRRSG